MLNDIDRHWTLCIFIISLILLSLLSGCSWYVERTFAGSVRDLQEIAVIIKQDYPLKMRKIDDLLVMSNCTEYHLLPGEHSITAKYVAPSGDYIVMSKDVTKTYNFEKGHVYRLHSITMGLPGTLPFEKKDLPLILASKLEGSALMIDWDMEIEDAGTVEEVASGIALRKHAPEHWRKLSEK